MSSSYCATHGRGAPGVPYCLQIAEILSAILELLLDSSLDGPKHVSAMARTCKAFKEPALDVYWRQQVDFYPLIRTMPEDLWEVRKGDAEEDHMELLSFKRNPKTSDWTRFETYARRVRSIGFLPNRYSEWSECTVRRMDHEMLVTLSLHRPTLELLPNLHSLSWSHWSHPSAYEYIRLFMGRKLRRFFADLHVEPPKLITMLDHLRDVAPTLANLDLCDIDESSREIRDPPVARLRDSKDAPAIRAAISDVILAQRSLRRIFAQTWTLSDEALLHLSSLSTLEVVHISSPGDDESRFASIPWPDTAMQPFSRLHHAHLQVDNVGRAGALLELMLSPHLTSLIVVAKKIGTSDLRQFFAAVGARCNPEKLTDLRLRLDNGEPLTNCTVDAAAFRPLLQLRKLEIFDVDLPCTYEVDDTMLGRMARAWPCLRSLDLGSYNALARKPPKITHEGLLTLLRHCPQLSSLGIVFDGARLKTATKETAKDGEGQGPCREVSKPEASPGPRPGRGLVNEWITEINVGRSTIGENQAEVAEFLSDVMPRLKAVWHRWCVEEARPEEVGAWQRNCEAWDDAERFVKVLGKVRRQEREWFVAAGAGVDVGVEPPLSTQVMW